MSDAPDPLPPFVDAHRQGLADFWQIYAADRAADPRRTMEAAHANPAFAHGMGTLPAAEHAALNHRTYLALAEAINHDRWADYRRALRSLGELYARCGLAFGAWTALVGAFRQRMMVGLAQRWAGDLPRLLAATEALLALDDFSLGLIAEAYVELRQGDRFRQLVEAMEGYAIFLLDPSGRVDSWNAGARLLLGYEAAEILGRPMAVFHPADAPLGADAILQTAAASGHFDAEAWRLRRDGRRFWAKVAISALPGAGSTPRGFAAVISDLSSSKEAFDRLAASERRLGEAEQLAHLGSWSLDLKSRQIDRSAELQRIYGWPPALIGTTPEESLNLVHPEDRARVKEATERAIRELTDAEFNWRSVRNDGQVRHLQSRMRVQRDAHGRASHLVGSVLDLTEQREVELALHARTAELESSNRALEAFSYSVAHDLRTPLRALNGFAQVLLEDYSDRLDASGRDSLQEICSNASRMGKLIDALLQLARTTRSELSRETVDLTALAHAVLDGLGPQTRPDGRVPPLQRVIASELHAELDPQLARTLLENLLGNAWKFTARTERPRIEMGVQSGIGGPVFFVRDNGAGFEPQYGERLFIPFQRLHPEELFPGTGIGLATAARIVERHGGRIWAEGQVGAGATFFFTLGPTLGSPGPAER